MIFQKHGPGSGSGGLKSPGGGFPREGEFGFAHPDGVGLDHHPDGGSVIAPLSHEGNGG